MFYFFDVSIEYYMLHFKTLKSSVSNIQNEIYFKTLILIKSIFYLSKRYHF